MSEPKINWLTHKFNKRNGKMTNNTINTDGRIAITNLRNYALHFRDSENRSDIVIPAGVKRWNGLTYREVENQVGMNNVMFTGVDTKGSNARIFIEDEAVRNAIFHITNSKELHTDTLTLDNVKKMLALKDIKKFKAEIEKCIHNEGDKQALIDLATQAGIDKATVAQKNAIEQLTGYKFSTMAENGEL